MNLPRRQFLHLAGGAAALPIASRISWAQSYPSRPVRVIVGYAPGGGTDIAARLIGQWLTDRLGQPFVIENRPGAAGNIGTEAAVRSAADGDTLLLVSLANAINATLYDKLNYNFIRDIAPVAGIIRVPNVMVVHPSLPVKTVLEFIAYARANPGKISMASAGRGSPPHLAGELFKMLSGIEMVHVPYRSGAGALTDLLGGQVQVTFESTSAAIGYVRGGALRALAVTTSARSAALPDVPTVAEAVPGYEAYSWYGIGAPRNTPAEIVAKLNNEISAALADPKLKSKFDDLGAMALMGSPADFGKLIADETEKWGKVIRKANITIE
jgi:tripartite-type tricarboxylate transporter receptor subunit TctC